jgi:hypothetical protein
MTDEQANKGPAPKAPALSPAGQRAQADHQARQAAALRENLARRKRQQRARAAGPGVAPGGEAAPATRPSEAARD